MVVCGGRWRVHVCGYRGHMVEGMCDVHVGGERKCMGDMWKCVCGGMSGMESLCRRQMENGYVGEVDNLHIAAHMIY